mmetsp:Transcript_3017/g.3837  ORF Transcript_3017/g.3837 Transcript_3017/m.3837 type:complete len:155 (-) Transcript_3017:187-651(-)
MTWRLLWTPSALLQPTSLPSSLHCGGKAQEIPYAECFDSMQAPELVRSSAATLRRRMLIPHWEFSDLKQVGALLLLTPTGQTFDKHRAELVPVFWTVPLQVKAPKLKSTHQALHSIPGLLAGFRRKWFICVLEFTGPNDGPPHKHLPSCCLCCS